MKLCSEGAMSSQQGVAQALPGGKLNIMRED